MPNLSGNFRALQPEFPRPHALGIGLAGAWAESDRKTNSGWPLQRSGRASRVTPTSDLETALDRRDASSDNDASPTGSDCQRTGSGCYGKGLNGECFKVGAWGHLLATKAAAMKSACGRSKRRLLSRSV